LSELQAVLFDMDGTLCDTEPSWIAAEHDLAARHGATWSEQDGLALVGRNLLDSGAYIKQRMGLPDSPAEVVDELIGGVIRKVRELGVPWMPGALELVEACNAAGVPTAMVTMSYRSFAGAIVEAMPRGRFDAVITGDEVDRGKPDPEPYLRAAEVLGVEPGGSIAIEDSPTGATSAEAAGCLVVVVPNHVEVPTTPTMVTLPTLSGVSPELLANLLSER